MNTISTLETYNVPAIASVDLLNKPNSLRVVTSDRLEEIAEDINHSLGVLVKAQANMALVAGSIGAGFLEAKAICKTRGRGKTANKAIPTWLTYCKKYGFSDTQADKYIRCHEFLTVYPQVAQAIPSLEDMSNFQKALKHDKNKAEELFGQIENAEVEAPWNPTCAGEWLAENLKTTKKEKPSKPKGKKPIKFKWSEDNTPTEVEVGQAMGLMDDPAGGHPAMFIRKLINALEENGVKIPNLSK